MELQTSLVMCPEVSYSVRVSLGGSEISEVQHKALVFRGARRQEISWKPRKEVVGSLTWRNGAVVLDAHGRSAVPSF
jgi:hypothetical protein